MVTYQQQKQRILQLSQATATVARAQHNAQIAQRLNEAAQHLTEGKLVVVVCGEYKQGKSSLLNALLNEPNLFPVDVDIATALVSSITYGPQEKVTVLLGERGQEQTKAIRREEIADYVTEQRNTGNVRQARMVVIETPNPQLKDGLVLVDTPGVGGLNIQHTDVTYAFLPNADAVLFVSDALAPMSAPELEFITERIAPHCQQLIFVVPKIDAVADYRAVVESNREKLAQALNRPGEEILIIPVSSALKLSSLRSQDPEDLEESNFAALEGELWRLLGEQRGYILLMRALHTLGRGVAELKGPLQVEWESLQQQSHKELDDRERQFQEVRQRLQVLLNSDAQWRTQLNRGLVDLRGEVIELFQNGIKEIRRQADTYLETSHLLDSPEQIVGLIETDIDTLITNLGKHLSQQAAALQERIEMSTGMHLNPFDIAVLVKSDFELPPMGHQPQQEASWWEKTLTTARNASFNGTAGATVGGIIGGVVGGLVGAFFGGVGAGPGAVIGSSIGGAIGGAAGIATGARQSVRQMRKQEEGERKREVSKVIARFIEDMQGQIRKQLNSAVTELEHTMQDDLVALIRQGRETAERTLQAIQDARKLSQEQADRRAAELRDPLQQLDQIEKSLAQVAQVTVEMGEAARRRTPLAPAQPVTVAEDAGGWADA